MRKRDLMTVKGIGKKEGNRLYRELNGNPEGVFYYEDKRNNFLFRQVFEQDVEFIKQAREAVAKETIVSLVDRNTGKEHFVFADQLMGKETNQEILDIMHQKTDECFSLIVFNLASKEFLCIIDVEIVEGTDYKEGAITVAFSKNKVARKCYEQKIKRRFNEICKESAMFVDGCKEKICRGNEEVLIPIL